MESGKVVGLTIEDQTRMTLTHIGKILAEAGCSMADVVKYTCHLKDIGDFDRFNSVYAEVFAGVRPARTTVQSGLGKGMRVEIDAIAHVPK